MKFNGGAAMGLFVAGISLAVVITAAGWPFKTALFPVAIGVPVFLMALTEFLINLTGKGEGVGDAAGFDFKLSDGDGDSRTALFRTLRIFGWIFGFFVLILLVGFPIAIPIFFLSFFKIYGKESWKLSIGLSAVAWASFYGLFVWLLNVPFREGWVFSLLFIF
ncbi:MAG: tripartite tricarboxylate transporter TctB family protein [Desulfobacterales bacterium]|nr:tripartite tricarboxylate transporter TctB family protein [Desulfobacterales bacterium]